MSRASHYRPPFYATRNYRTLHGRTRPDDVSGDFVLPSSNAWRLRRGGRVTEILLAPMMTSRVSVVAVTFSAGGQVVHQ
jgi:hypothetical protein